MVDKIKTDPIIKGSVDEMACRIRGMAIEVKWYLESLNIISNRAVEINRIKRFAHIWGIFQTAARDQLILKLCVIFGAASVRSKDQDSLIRLLHLVEEANPHYTEPLDNFVMKYSPGRSFQGDVFLSIRKTLSYFSKKHNGVLEGLRDVRNTRIAHSEADRKVVILPLLDGVDEMACFAYDFSCAALLSCVNVHSSEYKSIRKSDVFLGNILDRLYE